MKKKTKILLLASALCACTAGSAVFFGAGADTNNTVTFDALTLKDTYALNELFECPEISANVGGTEKATVCTITFPDGTVSYAEKFPLSQVGTYTIEYSVSVDGKLHYYKDSFLVNNATAGLFTGNNSEIKLGYSSIEEYSDAYGIVVNATPSGTVTYNKVVNLAKATKEEALFEIMATPKKFGVSDFTEFYITFTDVYDSENVLTIRAKTAVPDSYTETYMSVKTMMQPMTGLVPTRHTFTGDETCKVAFSVCYDNEEKALYTMHTQHGRMKIADLDDPTAMDNIWNGFTTGEVVMSISCGAVTSGSVQYIIKSVYGNNFTAEYPVDTMSPKIQLQAKGETASALVGASYAIPDATAFDNNGLLSFEKNVYYRYNIGNPTNVTVKDGAFTPKQAGVYTVVYKATDLSGNVTEETVEIEAFNELPTLTVDVEGALDETYEAGSYYVLKDYVVSGGAGNYTVRTFLRKAGADDIPLTSKRLYLNYATGEYELVYEATDYIGTKTETAMKLTLTENVNALMEGSISLPPKFVSGLDYKLPLVQSFYFVNGEKKTVAPTITATLNGSAVAVAADGTIQPTATADGDIVTVTYKYKHENGSEKAYTYEIPVVIAKNGNNIDQTKYFDAKAFTVEATSSSIGFTTQESGASVTFLRAVQAEKFSLGYQLNELELNVDYFDITLMDRNDFANSFTVRTYRNGKVGLVGGEAKTGVATINDGVNVKYTLNYDGTTHELTDNLGLNIAFAETTDDGEEFKGFSSDEILVRITAGNATGTFYFGISAINNQAVNRVTRDAIAPEIYINDLLGGEKSVGETVIVNKARVYDVYSNITKFTVSVRNQDTGEFVKTTDGKELNGLSAYEDYEVSFDKVGRYQVMYTAVDANKRSSTKSKLFNAYDATPPTIVVNGKVPTKATKGDTVTYPGMKVSDNVSAEENIEKFVIVVAPSGLRTLCEGTFVPEETGKYYVRYVAIDENGQIGSVEYTLTVE